MIKTETLLVCEMLVARYEEVVAENPGAMTEEFTGMVSAGKAALQRALRERQINFQAALRAVPTETDQASLVSHNGLA